MMSKKEKIRMKKKNWPCVLYYFFFVPDKLLGRRQSRHANEWLTVALAAGSYTLPILLPRAPTASSAHSTVIEAICNVAVW